MRKLNVEVQEESGRPGGGHAVIRLMGLQSLPDGVTYRIRPVDTALHADANGAWVESERVPLATRITTDGAELVVGPEIVENPAFMPGTLAVIEVAKCGVRGEFLWPRIQPLARPKRRHLIALKPQRPTVPEPVNTIAFSESLDASSHIEPEQIAPGPIYEMTPLADATAPVPSERVTSSEAQWTPSVDEAPITISAAEAIKAATTLTSMGSNAGGAATTHAPLEVIPPVIALPIAAQPARPHWNPKRLAAAIGSVTLLALVTGYAASSKPSAAKPGVAVARIAELTQLQSTLSSGAMSPRGTDTAGLAAQKLLEDADARLHGPEIGRDKKEAAFLLKRYLATTLGDERTMWALTQLGTVYAEPIAGGAPDYRQAKRLWELSASLGDPVAMCFVAALLEHGLGMPADKESALGWYRQSKQAGGCRDADVAIERLQVKR